MRSAHAQELVYPSEEISTEELLDRPRLTDKQVEFFHIYLSDPFLPLREICRQANIQQRTVKNWLQNHEPFKERLRAEQNRSRAVSNMSRKRVMRGMMEAVDMARDRMQPNVMLSGWKEIGRMCGFYEPERREVTLSVQSQEVMKEMRTLSREQLLSIAAQQDEADPVPEIYDDEDVLEHDK